jgi:hypothetical protein
MKVSVPAEAPTTPPDMGASINAPAPAARTDPATDMLVTGSIVEVSINNRSELRAGRALPSMIVNFQLVPRINDQRIG